MSLGGGGGEVGSVGVLAVKGAVGVVVLVIPHLEGLVVKSQLAELYLDDLGH